MNNLEAVKEAEEAAAKSGGSAPSGGAANVPKNESGLASETIFNMMGVYC